MITSKPSALLLALLVLSAPSASFAQARSSRAESPVDTRALAGRVRAEFLHAWRGYKQFAWGHDELRPLSKAPHDWYEQPLYMTQVDALDTLILLGLKEIGRAHV